MSLNDIIKEKSKYSGTVDILSATTPQFSSSETLSLSSIKQNTEDQLKPEIVKSLLTPNATSISDDWDWKGITYSPTLNMIVICGSDDYRVMTSPADDISWSPRATSNSADRWKCAAWINRTSKFYIGGTSSTGSISHSSDGISWTSFTITGEAVTSICESSSDSYPFVFACGGGKLGVSDGSITSITTLTPSVTWQSVCNAEDLDLNIAVGDDRVAKNTVGTTTWSDVSSIPTGSWSCVAYSPTQEKFVALSVDPTLKIMTSSDGDTWTASTPSGISGAVSTLRWIPELYMFVAISQAGNVFYSYNGEEWQVVLPAGNYTWADSCWDAQNFKLYAIANGTPYYLMSS